MKLIIDIPEDVYRRLKAGDTNAGNTFHNTALETIGNGIPYEERPQGEWIIHPHSMIMKCSLCGHEENAKDVGTINLDKHFCSNCGADLRGGEK